LNRCRLASGGLPAFCATSFRRGPRDRELDNLINLLRTRS
jgi:hypothetical protein